MAAFCTIVALNNKDRGPVADLFVAGLVFSFLSLLFYGWVTIPVGALVGWVIADRQSRGRVPS